MSKIVLTEENSTNTPSAGKSNLYIKTDGSLAVRDSANVEVVFDDTVLKDADIGVTVEAYDATILKDVDIGDSVEAYNPNIQSHLANTLNPHSVDIDDVTPTTTKGDLVVEDGTNAVRLPVGTNGQILTADSIQASGVKWASAVEASDVVRNSNNISLLHFYRATDHALSVQNFIDGFIDEFEDETGVDTGSSAGETHNASGSYYSNVENVVDLVSSTVTFNGSYSVSSQESNPNGLFFSSNGTKMYVMGFSGVDVNQYTLTTAWDVTGTVTFNGNYLVSAQDASPTALAFSTNGTKMYVLGLGSDNVNQYTLTTAWDVTGTVTYNGNHSVVSQDTVPQGLFFSSDGTKMYVTGRDGADVNQYTLTTAWDVTGTVTFNGSYSVSTQDADPLELFFNSIGTIMYVVGNNENKIYQYTLTTAWDVTGTVTFNGSYSVGSQEINPQGVFFNPDSTRMYVMGYSGDDVNQYTLAMPISAVTLYSNAFTAISQPDTANIVVYEEDVDAVTVNTDLIASVSRDGGTTYSAVTLVNVGTTTSGRNIYAGEVDISGQPAGTSIKYKIVTTATEMKIHGVSVQWQ